RHTYGLSDFTLIDLLPHVSAKTRVRPEYAATVAALYQSRCRKRIDFAHSLAISSLVQNSNRSGIPRRRRSITVKSDNPFAPRIAILAALLTLFGTGLPNLWAGSSKWTSIGPFGGTIQSLAIDPQNSTTLYAGTSSGVFKSIDGGLSWDNVNSALNVFS